MDTELKESWETALESGLFPQTNGYLNVNQTYCCLGVLCEVAIDQGMPVERYDRLADDREADWLKDSPIRWNYRLKGEVFGDDANLTPGLLELFDMTDEQHTAFVEFNDSEKLSLAEIADKVDEVLDPEPALV